MIQPLSSMRSALESRSKMGRMALVEIVRVFRLRRWRGDPGRRRCRRARVRVALPADDARRRARRPTLALAVTKLRWGVRPSLWWPTARAAAPLAAAGLLIALYYRFDIVLLGALKPEEDVGQ